MTPGHIRLTEFGVNAKATAVRYNGTQYHTATADIDCELVLEVTAYRDRHGELWDIEATHNGRRVYLTEDDMRAAKDLLADVEPVTADEPDLCERMGIGTLSIGVGTR